MRRKEKESDIEGEGEKVADNRKVIRNFSGCPCTRNRDKKRLQCCLLSVIMETKGNSLTETQGYTVLNSSNRPMVFPALGDNLRYSKDTEKKAGQRQRQRTEMIPEHIDTWVIQLCTQWGTFLCWFCHRIEFSISL